jgi:hypothetical protein
MYENDFHFREQRSDKGGWLIATLCDSPESASLLRQNGLGRRHEKAKNQQPFSRNCDPTLEIHFNGLFF